jgi:hypothetical protein
MRVSPTGAGEYKDGNQVLNYGRDIAAGQTYGVWYHCGLESADEPAFAMETDVEAKISVSVDTILVANADYGLFTIDRDGLTSRLMEVDGREQYVVRASDECVTKIDDEPDNHLRGNLWITPENAHGGYHKQQNEA